MDIASLNTKYGIAGTLEFALGKGGLPMARITSSHADAVISLYGAQVLSYRPKGKEETLWMSAKSSFEEGKAIRGGIPVCFPWFGAHATDKTKPQHGFARISLWDVAGAELEQDGTACLRLSLRDTERTHALWPHAFSAELEVRVGSSLEVALTCTNTGSAELTYTDALHTYLAVSDIGSVLLRGLGSCTYYEATETAPLRQEEALLEIDRVVNRRYIDTEAECVIEDRGVPRTISVAKKGSRITVVWNPWKEGARSMADMEDDGYRTMLCVEAVNTLGDAVVLAPGKSFTLGTVITVD